MVAQTPELALKDDETAMYAKAISDAQKHFPIPVLDPKWVAVGALLSTAFVIHRRMFVEVNERKARAAKIKANGGTVETSLPDNRMPEPAPWFNLNNGPPN